MGLLTGVTAASNSRERHQLPIEQLAVSPSMEPTP